MISHSKPTISPSDSKALARVLSSTYLSDKQHTRNFEAKLKNFIRVKFAIATNSGTSALHLILLALGISKNEEVIIPSYVCTSVLNAIRYVKATPVICDIELNNFNLSLKDTQRKITEKTKAIILPYMFGLGAAVDKFLQLGVPIIEDCAQSLGASYKGKKLGDFGIASIFSFYATKVITTGQGGMILTNSAKVYKVAKDLIEYDKRNDYKVRYNYKMTDLQAALGLAQLKRINTFIKRRREIIRYYNKVFSRYGIVIPDRDPSHIYYRYVIRIKVPINKFIQKLKEKGIEAKSPVFKPLHRYLKLDKRLFPNTEEAFKTTVSLPIYPSLTDGEMRLIAKSVLELL